MMNKSVKFYSKKILNIILFVIALWMFFVAYQNLIELRKYLKIASLYQANSKLSAVEAKELYENNIDNLGETFVIWGEKRNVSLYNEEFQRYCETNHIVVCGQINILFTDKDISYFPIEDKDGCMIDEKTAFQLFGDRNASGKSVTYNGRKYIIRSVIKNESSLFITQLDENVEDVADTVTMKVVEGETSGYAIQKMETAFTMQASKVDFEIFVDIANIFLWLLLSFIVVRICFFIRKDTIKISWLIRLIIFIIYVLLCIKFFSISSDNIPEKWSDYDYWYTFLEIKKENIVNFIRMPKRLPELKFVISFIKIYIYGLLGFFFIDKNRNFKMSHIKTWNITFFRNKKKSYLFDVLRQYF